MGGDVNYLLLLFSAKFHIILVTTLSNLISFTSFGLGVENATNYFSKFSPHSMLWTPI
jgi:hypothetical protein